MDWTSNCQGCAGGVPRRRERLVGKAHIRGGQVRGPAAILTPARWVSDGNIEMHGPAEADRGPGAARRRARPGARAGDGMERLGRRVQAAIPGAYPSFAAFPGPMAPPTPAAPIALSKGGSAGEMALKAPVLAGKLTSALRTYAGKVQGGSLRQAVKGLADWSRQQLPGVEGPHQAHRRAGQGNVPTFAPPYVRWGRLVMGDNVSAGPVFAGRASAGRDLVLGFIDQ